MGAAGRALTKLTDARDDVIVAAMRSLVALVLVAAAAAPLHAANRERIAIAVFNVTGEPLAEEAQQKLRTSLRGGLNAAGFDVVADAEVERAVATAGVAGCDTIACMRRIGELVLVRRVVKATIEVIGPSHVASTLELIDLADGKTVASANDDCTACRTKEVNDGLSNAAAALRMQLEPSASAPPPLVPPTPPPVETAPSHRSLYLGLAAGSGALFVGSVVALAVSGAYHGHCNVSVPTGERCPTRWNGLPGIVLGAIGTPVFGVATAIFAYKAWKSPRRLALLPTVGNRAAALELSGVW